MSYATETPAIYSTFDAGWANRTPVVYENEVNEPAGDAAWVRLGIEHEPAERVSIGESPRRRYFGTIVIDIRAPVGVGPVEARGHADAAMAVFRAATVADITFRESSISFEGVDDGRYRVVVLVPFERDTIF